MVARDSRSKLDIPALKGWLWEAACVIRGPVDAPKFRDYILSLIFLKSVSYVFEDEIRRYAEELGGEALAAEAAGGDRRMVRFYIPPEAR